MPAVDDDGAGAGGRRPTSMDARLDAANAAIRGGGSLTKARGHVAAGVFYILAKARTAQRLRLRGPRQTFSPK
jgi:hypothetical protein